jgi:hypothetical protein
VHLISRVVKKHHKEFTDPENKRESDVEAAKALIKLEREQCNNVSYQLSQFSFQYQVKYHTTFVVCTPKYQ